MAPVSIHYRIKKLKDYLALKTEMVNHQAIIREVAGEVEHSWIYYLMLLTAGLIALLGLLTNSIAVVIGAMLISPLMGPIISSGLALTIGDLRLARRAFRAIATSVFLTILVTTLVTLLSPLKDPTSEILARVRPNIYDLFVAMLSGIVGAVALCTKRNYLITATGVAVATAVIPPLSVVGYGLGTAQPLLAGGGFLLFFTNFVAIVLSSDLVFFIMGFRTSHVESIKYSLRKRLLVIGTLLTLISIPLVYTLAVDIQKLNAQKRIERVLKKHLNKEEHARMTGYHFEQMQKKMNIRVTVNTVQYFTKSAEQAMKSELKKSLGKEVDLHLEQVLVTPEAIPEQMNNVRMGHESLATQQEDITAQIGAKATGLAVKAEEQLATSFAPFPITGLRLAFSTGQQPLKVTATLQRDWPISSDELLLLSRQLERLLKQPLSLHLDMAPLLPPITFTKSGEISPESVATLDLIQLLPGGPEAYRYQIELARRNVRRRQVTTVEKHLVEKLRISSKTITIMYKHSNSGVPNLRLRILRHE